MQKCGEKTAGCLYHPAASQVLADTGGQLAKKRKYPKSAPGTWIERELFLSPTFFKLAGIASQLLIVILGKRRFETISSAKRNKRICTNSDNITFTYKEAESLGISKPAFTRALDELLAKGFLEIVHQGGACQGDKTIFKLSDKWRLWRPGIVFSERKKEPVSRGFCKPKKQK